MPSIKLTNVSLTFPSSSFATNSYFGFRNRKSSKTVSTPNIIASDGVHALQEIDFSISDGDRIGIIGSNGSGKTTLLRVLGGMYFPTHGKIQVQGSVGTLLDISLGINPEATGRENIYVRGALLGLSKVDIKNRFDEIVDLAGIGEFIELPTKTYSSGMYLRLAFAVATTIEPEILIMDEWLAVGDEAFNRKAQIRLDQILNSTKILILASHSRDLLERTCNRILWMENGRIKEFGDTAEVLRKYFN